MITLAVETFANSAQGASSENSQKADAVITKIKGMLRKDLGDSIKTSSYSIQPIYQYDSNKRKDVLNGYRASNQIDINTKQVTNAGSIVDAAVNAGANQVSGINFIIENNKEYTNKVITDAINTAKSQANAVAAALGLKITGVKRVVVSCGGGPVFPMYRMMGAVAGAPMQAPTPIEPGEVKIDSGVSIDFYVQ